jgi:hypothetical protein
MTRRPGTGGPVTGDHKFLSLGNQTLSLVAGSFV